MAYTRNPGASEKQLEREERARKKGFGVFQPKPSAPKPKPKPSKPIFSNPFESDAAMRARLKKSGRVK